MKSLLRLTACFCLFGRPATGQQIGLVDLTHTSGSVTPFVKELKPNLPRGCEYHSGGIADGAVLPKKGEQPEITLEIKMVGNTAPLAASKLRAEVQLRNSGKYPVQIPWAPDPSEVVRGQDPNHQSWQMGSFRFLLDRSDLLKSPGQSLYGSESLEGSLLTIRPGEWISAKVKFKLELEYPIRGESLRPGERRLRFEWEQANYKWDVRNCEQVSSFFSYRNYYKQLQPAVSIFITRDR